MTALGLLGVLLAHWRHSQKGLFICKPIASTGFVLTAIVCGAANSTYGQTLLLAFALCWLGDVLLMWRRTPVFLAGLFSFLMGHLAFATAFAQGQLDTITLLVIGLVCLPLGLLVVRWLRPHLSPMMRAPVYFYIIAIGAMTALAAAVAMRNGQPIIALAAICFCISDLGVARERFVASHITNHLWLLPLYYGAQTLFACSLLFYQGQ